MASLTKQLEQTEAERRAVDERLQAVQKQLLHTEEGKRGLNGRLSDAQCALMLQSEKITKLEQEGKVPWERFFLGYLNL